MVYNWNVKFIDNYAKYFWPSIILLSVFLISMVFIGYTSFIIGFLVLYHAIKLTKGLIKQNNLFKTDLTQAPYIQLGDSSFYYQNAPNGYKVSIPYNEIVKIKNSSYFGFVKIRLFFTKSRALTIWNIDNSAELREKLLACNKAFKSPSAGTAKSAAL